MAYVDLGGGDAQRIRDQYKNSLGRDASDDEVSGWLSGSYGGGGTDDWLRQIQGSGEAQARQPQPRSDTGNAPIWSENTGPLDNQPPTNHGYTVPQGSGYGQDFFDSLNTTYQTYLGRGASADEVGNWWSGQYGHGQGWGGFNQFREAIRTSGEAAARNNGQAPTPYYMDTTYWQGQGVNESDIFDAAGQMKPGWQRTAKGYERTGATGTTGGSNVPGPQGGNFESWLMQLTQGKPPSPQTLKSLEPILNQYGIKLGPPNARGWSDGVFLPDGTFLDMIEGATENGGVRWQTLRPSGGVGGGPLPGNQFSDPYTQLLEQLIKSRIGNLQGGINDPNRAMYEQGLKDRAASLATGNKQLDQLTAYLQERFTNLKGPGYTGAENEVLRTGALDPIETDRAAAKKRVIERLSARGLTLDSGIAQQALLEVDKAFDGMRATTQTQLAGNELGRREDRNQRAEAIAGQLADIPDLRAREQLDVFQALNNLSLMARQEDEARSREAISYGGVLSDLGPQRLNVAMQAAGMGGNTAGLSGLLSQIAGLNQNGQAYNAQNSNSLWSGLGSIAAILARQGQTFGGAGI